MAVETAEQGADATSIRRLALAGVALVGLRGLAIRAIGFLSSLVLARLLMPADFGTLSFGQAFIGFASLLGDVGLAAALLRRPEPPTRRELKAVSAFQLVVVGAVTLATASVALATGTRVGAVTALIVTSMPIAVYRTPTTLRLERDLQFGRLAFAEVLETLAYMVVAIGATALGAGVWGVAAAIVFKVAVGTAYLLARDQDRVLLPAPDWRFVRSLMGFGLQFQLNGALLTVRGQGVNIATASLASLSTLGVWSLAERLMLVPFLLFESLYRVTYPAIARMIDAGEDPAADIERGLARGTALTGVTLVGLSAAAPLYIPVVFGAEWIGASSVIPLASAGLVVIGPISSCCGGFVLARGDASTSVRATTLSIFAYALVSLPLLSRLGPMANGLGWLAASLSEAFIFVRTLNATSDIRTLPNVLPIASVAVAVGGLGYAVGKSLDPTIFTAAAVVFASTATYVAVLRLTHRRVLVDTISLARRSLGLAIRRSA